MSQLLLRTMHAIHTKIIATCCLKICLRTKTNNIIRRLGTSPLLSAIPSSNNSFLKSLDSYENNLKQNSTNRVFYSSVPDIDSVHFESVCAETLDSLCEWFDDFIEKTPELKSADVTFGDGVLTVSLGAHGTYVINRQSPNRQIWLSSPSTGPKRYDFIPDRKGWVYRHDNKTLHQLLQTEMSAIVKSPVDLSRCAYFSD